MEGLVAIVLFLVIGLIWLIPLVMLIKSDRTSGGTKVLWVLLFLFISWFAWLAYILLVPKQQQTDRFSSSNSRKNSEGVIAFVVCFFFGFFGLHRFIYGKVGTGILMLITFGGLGIWWLIDLIRIAIGHFTDSKGNHLSLIHNH